MFWARVTMVAGLLGGCAVESAPYQPDLAAAWGCAVPETCPLPDPVAQGAALFERRWTPADPRAGGDGLGPVFNADSCATCHATPRVGGAGGVHHNAQFVAQNGRIQAVHRAGTSPGFEEWRDRQLAGVLGHGSDGMKGALLPRVTSSSLRFRPLRFLLQRNTPALFGAGLIERIPTRELIALSDAQLTSRHVSGRLGVDAEGRFARFGWKGDVASLHDFVGQACANELGLSTERRVEPTSPLDAPISAPRPDLSTADVHALTAFIAALPAPPAPAAHPGARTFDQIGCAECHVADVGDVRGLYSDLLLHDMGPSLADTAAFGAYGQPAPLAAADAAAAPSEFRTPPLWGVADSGPWLHDGRATSLEQAIHFHRGEADHARRQYLALDDSERGSLVAFLETLRAPPSPDS